ncbi:MAG: helix-turn-helix domain-containing protein [Gemmatimonadota bacterium]
MTTPTNRSIRNDGVTMIDTLFGDVEGWTEAVADATEAAGVAHQVYALRARHKITQRELAERVGTTQSAIARLEDADYDGHSLTMLKRIGLAVGEGITVAFSPLGDRSIGRRTSNRAAPKQTATSARIDGRKARTTEKTRGQVRENPSPRLFAAKAAPKRAEEEMKVAKSSPKAYGTAKSSSPVSTVKATTGPAKGAGRQVKKR